MKLKNIAMITEDKVTEIFCIIDEFCKFFEQENGKNYYLLHLACNDRGEILSYLQKSRWVTLCYSSAFPVF